MSTGKTGCSVALVYIMLLKILSIKAMDYRKFSVLQRGHAIED